MRGATSSPSASERSHPPAHRRHRRRIHDEEGDARHARADDPVLSGGCAVDALTWALTGFGLAADQYRPDYGPKPDPPVCVEAYMASARTGPTRSRIGRYGIGLGVRRRDLRDRGCRRPCFAGRPMRRLVTARRFPPANCSTGPCAICAASQRYAVSPGAPSYLSR